MGQYQLGKVAIANGTPTVRALWEIGLLNAPLQFHPEGRLEFQASGALARCISHSVATGIMLFDVISGTPQSNELVDGPSTNQFDAGTSTSGGAGSLTDTGKAWTTNQYAGEWCGIRVGTPTEEWRKITSNTATTLNVSPNWATPPVTSAYVITQQQQAQGNGFRPGTPQDWTAPGAAAPGHTVVIDDHPVSYEINSVAAQQLDLLNNYTGGDKDGVTYTIQRDRTAVQRLPRLALGDTKGQLIFTDLVDLLEDILNNIFGQLGGILGKFEAWNTLLPGANWQHEDPGAADIGLARYAKSSIGAIALGGGVVTTATVNDQSVFGTLPSGYRPTKRRVFVLPGGFSVDILTNGSVRYRGAQQTSGFTINLDGIVFTEDPDDL